MSRKCKGRGRLEFNYELDPWPHPYEADRYCIPLKRRKYGDYRVYISRNIARFFTEETLPGFIKSQLSMIYVLPQKFPLKDDAEVSAKGTYKHYINSELPEIGWRLSESFFIVILSKDQLILLDSPSELV